ncbi:MAG TPA: class I SAM-dependent methyltransferase [Solirubrobacteraceae bacterium]|nr:class I SAM-dependent methyltransferase [Solirubrobacteraceae bacterium]
MATAEQAQLPLRRNGGLSSRYSVADLDAFTDAERRRYVSDLSHPQRDEELAWELLYRREPRLYDRLASAERLHPDVVAWLPEAVERIVEIGAGAGRLTLELVDRARAVWAVEPAAPLRALLLEKLSRAAHGDRARVVDGFFDELALDDDFADLVVTCSAFTPEPAHGGERGLAEMERVCRPGGCVAIVWPNNLDWLAARGFRHVSFPGEMFLEFASPEEAVELIEIFHPHAAPAVRAGGSRRVAYSALGVNPPRDIAYKVLST